MAAIKCNLECQHSVMREAGPNATGPDSSLVGRIVFCPECGEKKRIITCESFKRTESDDNEAANFNYDNDGFWACCPRWTLEFRRKDRQ